MKALLQTPPSAVKDTAGARPRPKPTRKGLALQDMKAFMERESLRTKN